MNVDTKGQAANTPINEELRDVLIAISVVTKRLATKLEKKDEHKGEKEK